MLLAISGRFPPVSNTNYLITIYHDIIIIDKSSVSLTMINCDLYILGICMLLYIDGLY